MKMKTLRNMDAADLLIRERTPFRSRVRLFDRYGDFGPLVSLSGTVPCRVMGDWFRKYPEGACVEASAKGQDRWGESHEGTVSDLCHSRGNLPPEYHESLLASDFVVRSFQTPIAWHVNAPTDWRNTEQVEAWINDEHPGMWIVPNVRYSPTTGQHQSQVEWALRGHWRMPEGTPALDMQELQIEGALTSVPSGGR